MFLAKYLNTKTWGIIPVKKQLHGNNLNPRTLCSMQAPKGQEQIATNSTGTSACGKGGRNHQTSMAQKC